MEIPPIGPEPAPDTIEYAIKVLKSIDAEMKQVRSDVALANAKLDALAKVISKGTGATGTTGATGATGPSKGGPTGLGYTSPIKSPGGAPPRG